MSEKNESAYKCVQNNSFRRKLIYHLLTENPEITIGELNVGLEGQSYSPINPLNFALWRDYYHPIVARDISLYCPVVVQGETLSYLGRLLLHRSRKQSLS
jgi:hypothetical protein